MKNVHEDITQDRILAAADLAERTTKNTGFCNACGEDTDGVEPDAQNYTCECCGKSQVYGFLEFILSM